MGVSTVQPLLCCYVAQECISVMFIGYVVVVLYFISASVTRNVADYTGTQTIVNVAVCC